MYSRNLARELETRDKPNPQLKFKQICVLGFSIFAFIYIYIIAHTSCTLAYNTSQHCIHTSHRLAGSSKPHVSKVGNCKFILVFGSQIGSFCFEHLICLQKCCFFVCFMEEHFQFNILRSVSNKSSCKVLWKLLGCCWSCDV